GFRVRPWGPPRNDNRKLAARHAVGVAHAFREAVLAATLAAVLGAEHRTGARDAIDLVGVLRMDRHPHHRRVGLDAVVEALPGLADILAAIDRAVGAACRRGERGIEDFRVDRGGPDVATISLWRELADLHVDPVL